MAATGIVLDVDAVVQAALEREAISTTGIGEGIAIPHAATASCTAPLLGFARSRTGVDWNSLDGAPATLIFMIAVPETGIGTEHLKVLAHLSRSLMTPSFRDEIEHAATAADVLAALAASVRPSGPAATACSTEPAGARLQRQPEQAGGVAPVHRRPAVRAVADVARDARRRARCRR